MSILEKVRGIVAECMDMDIHSLDDNAELFEMEGFDSMRSVMILAKIEDEFGIMIPEDDIFDLATINEWAAEVYKIKEQN